ncbi:hypothetical protein GF420_06455 [candidate division GN15 bacterium]|nr:hypothetical protein [candidate division GN15 bacterium]
MMVRLIVAVIVTAMLCPSLCAIEFGRTPVQDAMRAQLQGDDWKDRDEFDDPPQEDEEDTDEFDQPRVGVKSTVQAALYSALLPGAGQYYLGKRKKARYFFAAEALTWIGYFSFKTYSGWKEDDYVRFAQRNANARLENKDDEFRDLVGFYTSTDEYNAFGRVFDPERPYYPDSPEYHWQWQDEEDQKTYRHLKNRAREADRRSEFMLGVAIVDRIISVIDAIRDGQKLKKQITDESFSTRERPDMKLKINPFASKTQIKLTLYTDFQ